MLHTLPAPFLRTIRRQGNDYVPSGLISLTICGCSRICRIGSKITGRTGLLFLAILVMLTGVAHGQPDVKGSLVIVGGGLEDNNKTVFQAFISLAGGAEKAVIAIVPSASGTPMQSFVYFKNLLISYGLKAENIHLVNVAVMDDDSTTDVNEATWKDNGEDSRLAELVSRCTGVWFSGGDQLRTTRTLFRADGSETAVLKAIWTLYRSGGVVGGTSAGAAIMSRVMICGGSSLAALTHGVITQYNGDDFPDKEGVLVSTGLGFFPHGIVDQHFHARARFGRTILTLLKYPESGNLAFGVDENTALIYKASENRMSVAGTGGVTLFNASAARLSYKQQLPAIENMMVSYLEEGDSYDFTTGRITPATGKISTRGKEHYSERYSGQDGLLTSGKISFRELITEYLADNQATDTIQNITFVTPGSGFRVTLYKTASTEAFCPEKPRRDDRYTVVSLGMDITPVSIITTPIK